MANKAYSIEWLTKSYHDLDSANILSSLGHYTDTIGYLYHQSMEKTFKAIIAYQNQSIPKTHNLIELSELLDEYFSFNEDELILLAKVTTYCTKQRYPSIDKILPSNDEIIQVQEFAIYLFDSVCDILKINKKELE